MIFVAIVIALSWPFTSSTFRSDDDGLVFYRIFVTTSNDWGAGSNADVWLTIVGENGTVKTELDNLMVDDFEQGIITEFKQNLVDVGPMRTVIVERNDNGSILLRLPSPTPVTGNNAKRIHEWAISSVALFPFPPHLTRASIL